MVTAVPCLVTRAAGVSPLRTTRARRFSRNLSLYYSAKNCTTFGPGPIPQCGSVLGILTIQSQGKAQAHIRKISLLTQKFQCVWLNMSRFANVPFVMPESSPVMYRGRRHCGITARSLSPLLLIKLTAFLATHFTMFTHGVFKAPVKFYNP